MPEATGIVLLLVGGVGYLFQCMKFVRVTLHEHYGSNPGFGALEVMVMPWFLAACIGLGMVLSWQWGAAVFAAGIFLTGFLAMLLARLFGRQQ